VFQGQVGKARCWEKTMNRTTNLQLEMLTEDRLFEGRSCSQNELTLDNSNKSKGRTPAARRMEGFASGRAHFHREIWRGRIYHKNDEGRLQDMGMSE
jgi:hypothetical protein